MKKTKRIILAALVLILAVAYVIRVVQVNLRYPAAEQVRVRMPDSVSYDGITYEVVGFRFMTEEELNTYHAQTIDPSPVANNGKKLYKCVLVDMKATNTTQEEKLARFTFFSLQSGIWRNAIDLQTLWNYDEDGRLARNLAPGESVTQPLPYSFAWGQFKSDKLWEGVEDRDYELVLTLYPVKRVIEIE